VTLIGYVRFMRPLWREAGYRPGPRRFLFIAHVWLRRGLGCGCHWHPTYGLVVMGGCPRHD